MAVTSGTSVSVLSGPEIGGQSGTIEPVLQAQDGSFVGTASVGGGGKSMVAFDGTGKVRWSVPNYSPQIATADGGVIATDNCGTAVIFDQNGNATGQMASLPTYSWTLNAYQRGSIVRLLARLIIYAYSHAAAKRANPSGSGTYVIPHSSPQEALYAPSKADLTATPECNALMAQFAQVAQIPEATLINQLKATANRARSHVYNGPSSGMQLDAVEFPGAASPGVTTVGQWFAVHSTFADYADGFSQFNDDPVWFRLDDWHSWILGFGSKFLEPFTGKLGHYGMGTVMHEILHKQTVGGGFTHDQMNTAIGTVGWPPLTVGNEDRSEGIGQLCFGNLH